MKAGEGAVSESSVAPHEPAAEACDTAGDSRYVVTSSHDPATATPRPVSDVDLTVSALGAEAEDDAFLERIGPSLVGVVVTTTILTLVATLGVFVVVAEPDSIRALLSADVRFDSQAVRRGIVAAAITGGLSLAVFVLSHLVAAGRLAPTRRGSRPRGSRPSEFQCDAFLADGLADQPRRRCGAN